MDESYRYFELPLTPAVIEHLIIETFSGQTVTRQLIIDKVVETHVAKGGSNPKAMNVTSSVKMALNNMRSRGIASNPGYGYWKFTSDNDEVISDELKASEEMDIVGITDFSDSGESVETIADLVVGEGFGKVYLYFLPVYQEKAQMEGKNRWPCKIGRTERDLITRILSQASTALPEKPKIALVINTDFSSEMEAAIHAVLTLRKQKIADSPGTEWFNTNPDEVLEMARFFEPNM